MKNNPRTEKPIPRHDVNIGRRTFIRNGALAAAGAAVFPSIIPAKALGRNGSPSPNGKIGLGIIGCGGRGCGGIYASKEQQEVVAVCDPVRERQELASKRYHKGSKPYSDLRELLADPAVDAVMIATSDYWHVPATLMALKAGKHCYTEKPLGVSIEQDLACRKAVKDSGLTFQYGTMQRCMPQYPKAVELVLNGFIGEVKALYALNPSGATGGEPDLAPVPDGVDYDLWLGPAPRVPFDNNRVFCYTKEKRRKKAGYYNYDYSIGNLGGWGAHSLDIIDWWADLDGRGVPVTVEGTGVFDPNAICNAISHWDVTARFADGLPLHFINSGQKAAKDCDCPELASQHQGDVFLGSKGWIYVNRKTLQSNLADYRTMMSMKLPVNAKEVPRAGNHGANFFNAIHGKEKTIASIDSAVRSDIVSQLSDIAIRLGRQIKWNPKTETITGDDQAAAMASRNMREPFSIKTIMNA